jgi:mannose-6-phosphate isomerase-like protein (cupin superfamily)
VTYDGAGEASAILQPEEASESLLIRTTTARFVAPGSMTAQRFGLFRWDMAPNGGGAGAHFHRTFSESFFVLSGGVMLYDGQRWNPADPGDFLYVPEGGIHGFRNDRDEPASMLILFAPAPPRERYFRELADVYASGRTMTRQDWLDLWARHDQYPAEE